MKKICLFSFLLFFLFCNSIKNTYATFSFSISNIEPTQVITKDKEISINISITDLPNESYFVVGWQKNSSGQYIGYTKGENDNWVAINSLSSDNCSGYPKITDTSITSLTLTSKIGDYDYIDNTDYLIKVFRFTSTCKSYKASDNDFFVTVSLPVPTPTPDPTLDPTPELISTPRSNPTATPKPTPTKYPTPKPSVKLITAKNDEVATPEGDILGENIVSKSSSESDKIASNSGKSSQNYLGWIFFTAGIFLSSSAGFLAFQKAKEGKVLI